MRRLAERGRARVVALLDERYAFAVELERLYAAVAARLDGAEPALRRMLPHLEEQALASADGARWIAERVSELGTVADARAQTARRRLLEIDGVRRIVEDPGSSVFELLHALLAAELVDGDGWHVLARVAESAGDEPAREEFERRQRRHDEHAAFLRRAVTELARNHVLGMPVSMPIAP